MKTLVLNSLILLNIWLFLFPTSSTVAQNIRKDSLIKVDVNKKYTLDEYVSLYKDIAIQEMERSGIPASITLAQGIHESGCGNSLLAKQANNHFGIKCHKGWDGKTYYQWDDDPQESCFRVYDNAESSYIDHTEFLKTRNHYSFLFDYDHTDYTKWAKGLKKAGYATDPKYPDKLIGTIERHGLSKYDLAMSPVVIANITDTIYQPILVNEVYVKPEDMQRRLRRKPRSFLFSQYKKGLFRQNGCTYAHARENETPLEFATRFDIPYRKFLIFNDLVDGDQLINYQYCYIQPKKTKFKGEVAYHRITDDITMYEIAQYYGLRLDVLLERNLLREGQEPRNGELVMLNEKVSVIPALRISSSDDKLPIDSSAFNKPVFPKYPIEMPDTSQKTPIPQPPLKLDIPTYPDSIYNPKKTVNTTVNPDERYLRIDPEKEDPNWIDKLEEDIKKKEAEGDKEEWIPNFPNDKETQPDLPKKEDEIKIDNIFPDISEGRTMPNIPTENNDYFLHKVTAKETLFGLQRRYGINWQRIKEYNGLTSDLISENQIIKIPKK